MYLAFYQLERKPFQLSTDPKFLWLGEKHAEALATLRYGIMEDKGFLLLTGDVGTGKTALIKRLVEMIDVAALVATVPDPGLEAIDFFNYLAEEFRMQRRFASKGDFLIEFKQFLLKAYSDRNKVLLIIDEAQRLNHDLLEQVRLLSNIELDSRKLINIFFVGQTEFHRMLLEERNRAVRQRISVSYFIEPLTETETLSYIRHRLKVAGAAHEIFSPEAMRRVYAFSRGYPRLINIICDHALLSGYASGLKTIDVAVIRECEKELRLPEMRSAAAPAASPGGGSAGESDAWRPNPEPPPERSGGRRAAVLLVLALLVVFGALMAHQYRSDDRRRWAFEEIAPQEVPGLSGRPAFQEEPPAVGRPEAAPPPRAPAAPSPPPAAAPAPANPFLRGKVVVYFQFNSNELRRESMELLDEVAAYLLVRPGLRLSVNGYSDALGQESYNVNVSQFRANAVKSYLVGKGIEAGRIVAAGQGSKNPIAPNDTPENRERNRRVEIEPIGG